MEFWDAYDVQRQPTGEFLERGKPIPDELYHLVVNAFIQHIDGDFLFMKRSSDKELHPNIYECGAGGSVLADETSLEAAQREMLEETGLQADQLERFYQETSTKYQCHFDYYLAQVSGDKTAVCYQAGETDGHIWVAPSDLDVFFKEHPTFSDQKVLLEMLLVQKDV